MVDRTNGYITIVAGLPQSRGAPSDRHAPLGRKRELAERQRRQGWSYRRISETLDVPYGQIQQWLDVPAQAASPLLLTGTDHRAWTSARSNPANDSLQEASAAQLELVTRVDQLASMQQKQAAALDGLETRLIDLIRAEVRSLGKRLLRVFNSLRSPGTGDPLRGSDD